MSTASNTRVAKNAVALAIRMVIVTVIGLYTSRIVLNALGVDDYGIYGVIGGVVGMASFLNTSMAGATSRFITFDLGSGKEERLKDIFSTALIIHIAIAVVVVLLAETVGLWFVNCKMNFPPDRMFAVNVLYQFTILSMVINFTQVPYTADIIAHEKMSVFAYFEIINAVLKLLIVLLLLIASTDRLILYAALTLAVSIINASLYRIYCVRHFPESKFRFVFKRSIIRDMLAFSSFDLYGNMCVVANTQGIPIILNIFFGVVANAGASIAITVTGVIKGFSTSVMQAFRPQIIKLYASDNIPQMQIMMTRAVQFALLSYGAIAIPMYIETPAIIGLWLGQVPAYSVAFIRIIIISIYFNLIVLVSNTAIHATGNIKNISFVSGSLFLLNPILSWFVLKYVITNAVVVYAIEMVSFIFAATLGCIFLHIQIPPFNVIKYLFSIVKSIVALIITLLIMTVINQYCLPFGSTDNAISVFCRIIVTTIAGGIILISSTYILAFNACEKRFISKLLKSKISKFISPLIN